jgi:site-specific DNA-methyltransferase (adenine-specific)
VRVEHIGDATLYLGDCREILPTLPKVDAVVTDPPYGISDAAFKGTPRVGKRIGQSNTWHAESTWDYQFPSREAELITDAAPLIAWFGHWRKRLQAEGSIAKPLRAEIIWAKDCHVGPPCPLAMRDERIWLFSDSAIHGRTFESSVWDVPIIPTWAQKEHKNEKPLALMCRLISFLTSAWLFVDDRPARQEIVLDPFMGSGTTGVACANLGRKFIGIEIEPKYFDIACERIAAAYAQGRLFA